MGKKRSKKTQGHKAFKLKHIEKILGNDELEQIALQQLFAYFCITCMHIRILKNTSYQKDGENTENYTQSMQVVVNHITWKRLFVGNWINHLIIILVQDL